MRGLNKMLLAFKVDTPQMTAGSGAWGGEARALTRGRAEI